MGISRCGLAGVVLAASIAYRSASAAPILMPAGSTVWMKFESNEAPFENGGDAAGSNLPGQAPPNGIPLTTVTASGQSTTGYAEILADRLHNFTTGRSQFMHSSFQDFYTVGGTATGPFDLMVQLHATGEMRPIQSGSLHVLFAGNAQAKIGTFNHDPNLETEHVRVTPFNPAAQADTGAHDLFVPGSIPIDITASYTKTGVNVGDVFDLSYQLRSAAATGEIDVFGAISFTLPDGVFLTSAMAQGLPAPGSIKIVGNDGINDGITVVNIDDHITASGSVEISDNPLVEAISIGDGSAGSVTITENDGATSISLGDVTTAAGSVTITRNDAATVIDIGNGAVGGDLAVTGNEAAAVVNIGNGTVGGDLDITGNSAATVINVGNGEAAGIVTITDNGDAAVNVSSLGDVGGDLTIESTGDGAFDVGSGEVGGDLDLSIDGYTGVEAPIADGQTAVTMVNSQATVELVLPTGAFPLGDPVRFRIDHLPGGTVETLNGDTVTHLESYQFNFDIPTLGQPAELNFEIDLLAMDEAGRQSLLDLLDADALLTLAVRGDDPDALLQLFDVCSPGTDPILDQCVRVLWFDENGSLLDPLAGADPSVIRFEGLVGHFSTYSVVAVTAVPEPASLSLLALGAATLLRRRRH